MRASAAADVYLDTDVLVNLAYSELPHAVACASAIQKLHDSGSVAYVSLVSHMEFAQAFRMLATRRNLVRHVIDEFQLDLWHEQRVRRRWMTYWRDELEAILNALPYLVELPLTLPVVRMSFDLMGKYALRSQDAVHLAIALHYEIPVFWTCDDHFQRVDDLFVEIIRDPA